MKKIFKKLCQQTKIYFADDVALWFNCALHTCVITEILSGWENGNKLNKLSQVESKSALQKHFNELVIQRVGQNSQQQNRKLK